LFPGVVAGLCLRCATRSLFGERGYASVGTEEIVRAAGVTRGALYVARAEDPDVARQECTAILDRILHSITPDA
jgi:hypothetical protein